MIGFRCFWVLSVIGDTPLKESFINFVPHTCGIPILRCVLFQTPHIYEATASTNSDCTTPLGLGLIRYPWYDPCGGFLDVFRLSNKGAIFALFAQLPTIPMFSRLLIYPRVNRDVDLFSLR